MALVTRTSLRAPILVLSLTGCFGDGAEVPATAPATEGAPSIEGRPGVPGEVVPDGLPQVAPDKPLPDTFQCGKDKRNSACFVHVPGGRFMMGAQATDPTGPNHDPRARPDEGPVHEVQLSPFWIGRMEVQASSYVLCVASGWCDVAEVSTEGFSNYGAELRGDHPINGVTWKGAQRYCAWMGGRLPTEAEWELAARGTDGRRYPWGNEAACGVKIAGGQGKNAYEGDGGTPADQGCAMEATVGMGQVRGASPYGALGMAGNVWEWVADWYAPEAYADHAATDPTGPASGEARVQRGGGWSSPDALDLRSAGRGALRPDQQLPDVGFRCVRPMMGETP